MLAARRLMPSNNRETAVPTLMPKDEYQELSIKQLPQKWDDVRSLKPLRELHDRRKLGLGTATNFPTIELPKGVFLHTLTPQLGKTPFQAITILCDPRYATQVPGLVATEIQFYVYNITWQPGPGQTPYHTYCPHDEYDPEDLFRAAKHHQILPLSKEPLTQWVGCSNPGICTWDHPGTWFFGVNDHANYYDDNQGYFMVDVTGWR
jgi:hypothetical protein